MKNKASTTFKVAYCLVVLGAVLPIGLAKSGWVGLATGRGGLSMIFPMLAPLVFLLLGLYRVYLVARVPRVLDSPATAGVASLLRAVGSFALYVGALAAIL